MREFPVSSGGFRMVPGAKPARSPRLCRHRDRDECTAGTETARPLPIGRQLQAFRAESSSGVRPQRTQRTLLSRAVRLDDLAGASAAYFFRGGMGHMGDSLCSVGRATLSTSFPVAAFPRRDLALVPANWSRRSAMRRACSRDLARLTIARLRWRIGRGSDSEVILDDVEREGRIRRDVLV